MMSAPAIRFPVDPRGVPLDKAARRLGLTRAEFERVAARLYGRGFPSADPDTHLFDLKAIDAWMDRQSGLTTGPSPQHPPGGLRGRVEAWDGS